MIEVDDLHKLYGDHRALRGVSFCLPAGSICGMVGPNGAGKTTTMRCLAGLIAASRGRLSVDGFDVSRQAMEVRRRLAFVPDDPPLFDDLTVSQHLELIAGLYRVPNHREAANELLARFELTAKANESATALSRGMRQKLAVCCCYLYDPRVVLLDEPLTGLDPPGIRTLLATLRERASTGGAVILSSHLLAMIEDICSHVLVMQQGEVAFFGTASELRCRHPHARTLEDAYFAETTRHRTSPTSVLVPTLADPPGSVTRWMV